MFTYFRRIFALAILCCLLLGIGGTKTAQAGPTEQTFTVDSFQDLNDNIPNSVCSVGSIDGGPCTLRAAITEANMICDKYNIIINIP